MIHFLLGVSEREEARLIGRRGKIDVLLEKPVEEGGVFFGIALHGLLKGGHRSCMEKQGKQRTHGIKR
jgi:hypothetical protein